MASPASRCSAMPARAFSTSHAQWLKASGAQQADRKPPQPAMRRNPLIGNYKPAQPKQPAAEQPPVTTEEPTQSAPPFPSQPPESSAEVPLNADMPPPPPPATGPAASPRQLPVDRNRSNVQYTYDAAAPPSAEPKPFAIDLAALISDKSAAYGREHGVGDPQKQPKVQTKAATGRTVFVRSGRGGAPTPMLALVGLNKVVRDQQVKTKYHSQKHHERKGLRKKRLRSERWRKRFKDGFYAALLRVRELKGQGW